MSYSDYTPADSQGYICYIAKAGPDENSLDMEIEFYLTSAEEKLVKEYVKDTLLRDEEPLKGIYKKAFDALVAQTIRSFQMVGRNVDETSIRISFLKEGVVIGAPHKY